MARRFTDTGLYEKAWFQELPNQYKLFWEYITKKCDNAGFWSINFGMVSYIFNGLKFKEDELLSVFGGRIVKIQPDKYFLPKFIRFQQKTYELNFSNLAHRQIIKLLEDNGLLDSEGAWKGLTSPLQGASKGLQRGLQGASKGLRYSIRYSNNNNNIYTKSKEKKIYKRKEKSGDSDSNKKDVYREDNRASGKW
jgi:hypothetical protein|tara:strand:+ start:241 stop:822 length:582 start_codon:yes stop_codon:yes gene_type:complete